jgi:hypothetical protein
MKKKYFSLIFMTHEKMFQNYRKIICEEFHFALKSGNFTRATLHLTQGVASTFTHFLLLPKIKNRV